MLDELRALLEERLRSMLAMLDEVAPAAFERIRATAAEGVGLTLGIARRVDDAAARVALLGQPPAAPGGVGLRPAAVGKDDKRA